MNNILTVSSDMLHVFVFFALLPLASGGFLVGEDIVSLLPGESSVVLLVVFSAVTFLVSFVVLSGSV